MHPAAAAAAFFVAASLCVVRLRTLFVWWRLLLFSSSEKDDLGILILAQALGVARGQDRVPGAVFAVAPFPFLSLEAGDFCPTDAACVRVPGIAFCVCRWLVMHLPCEGREREEEEGDE